MDTKKRIRLAKLKIVSFQTFESEILKSGLIIVEKGMTSSLPDFNQLMYAVVKKG